MSENHWFVHNSHPCMHIRIVWRVKKRPIPTPPPTPLEILFQEVWGGTQATGFKKKKKHRLFEVNEIVDVKGL